MTLPNALWTGYNRIGDGSSPILFGRMLAGVAEVSS